MAVLALAACDKLVAAAIRRPEIKCRRYKEKSHV